MEKAELIIAALQQRIGEITANYELQLASTRADYTQLYQQLEELNKQKAENEYSESISKIAEQAIA